MNHRYSVDSDGSEILVWKAEIFIKMLYMQNVTGHAQNKKGEASFWFKLAISAEFYLEFFSVVRTFYWTPALVQRIVCHIG